MAKDTVQSTTPKELVINIDLPLLTAANSVNLEIFETQLLLESEKPAKYKLNLKLPYGVAENEGDGLIKGFVRATGVAVSARVTSFLAVSRNTSLVALPDTTPRIALVLGSVKTIIRNYSRSGNIQNIVIKTAE